MNLLPKPKSSKLTGGVFTLPEQKPLAKIKLICGGGAPDFAESYLLAVSKDGIEIHFREAAGLRAASATLRQLLREYGRKLPCVKIRDWPDFFRRGVMLDISRGRVPKLETLLDLAEKLADFKINELQLYTEHTFAYRKFRSVWQSWGALTPKEIQILDARCRELGIDLVPNQNSFGHLREFLADPKLNSLAEISGPYEDSSGEFVRRPTTLAPGRPDSVKFLRGLYDELLPNFSSRFFNVGCDETWDLGRGQSKKICERFGKGRVYLDFLKKIQREVSLRGRTMMFWGDIILKYPKLIPELARSGRSKPAQTGQNGLASAAANIIALNWGYEANHPFEKETARFARAKIPFYVCPGTSTWQTLVGKHDNALANLTAAAKAGKKFRAIGYLITDWGDGGHPNPLAVSWPMFAAGAALAWNSKRFVAEKIVPVLGRDIYNDAKIAEAAFNLGFAHKILRVHAPNETPLGTVIAAPKPEARELFCRNGLKWFSKISSQKIRGTLAALEKLRNILAKAEPKSGTGKILATELDLAARMAAESCHLMLWQQAVATGKNIAARKLARNGVVRLKKLQVDFTAYWPLRNKATPKHSSEFLEWRIDELTEWLNS